MSNRTPMGVPGPKYGTWRHAEADKSVRLTGPGTATVIDEYKEAEQE